MTNKETVDPRALLEGTMMGTDACPVCGKDTPHDRRDPQHLLARVEALFPSYAQPCHGHEYIDPNCIACGKIERVRDEGLIADLRATLVPNDLIRTARQVASMTTMMTRDSDEWLKGGWDDQLPRIIRQIASKSSMTIGGEPDAPLTCISQEERIAEKDAALTALLALHDKFMAAQGGYIGNQADAYDILGKAFAAWDAARTALTNTGEVR